MSNLNAEIFYPHNQEQWRNWLLENHKDKNGVWVVFFKKNTQKPSITWSDSVDEALCFGWIDSVKRTLDAERSIQFFSKRKPKSTWSKINKEKVDLLIKSGRMTNAGLHCIEVAKANGSWQILDTVEDIIIPEDLENAFIGNLDAKSFFLSLSKSNKKILLQWLVLAKRPETRANRIVEIVESATQGRKHKLIG